MEIDKQDILLKVRRIYIRELGMFSEEEVDNDTYLGKMNGYKVDTDDLSVFIKAVQTDFNIPMVQADLKGLLTLRDYSNLVIQKLKEKPAPPTVEP